MKNVLFCLITMLFLASTTVAQYVPYKFGKLEDQEKEMDVCPIDENAAAVVIFDIGKTFFARNVDNFEVIHDRFMRIKILSDEGAKYSKITFPLYFEKNVKEKIGGIEANSWNLNGNIWQKTELPPKQYEKVVINDNYMLVTVEIPNVQKGTIVEIHYSINSPFFTPLHGWDFQNEIPTLFSFYEIRMIPFYEYSFLIQGKRPEIQKSFLDKEHEYEIGKNQNEQYGNIKYNEMVYLYGMNNLPANTQNGTRIDFQLTRIVDLNGVSLKVSDTWEKTIKELITDDRFGDFADKATKKADKLMDLNYMLNLDASDRLYTIVRHVKDKYTWNGVFGKYTSLTMNDFLENKKGNAGAINLFTIGLLRAAGIDAYPVLLSTKNNNQVNTDFPFLHLYDYVLIGANINNEFLLTDATEPLLADDQIPMHSINRKGLIIQKNKEQWLNCVTPDSSFTHTSVKISIPENSGSLKVSLSKAADGYDGFLLRNQFKDKKAGLVTYFKDKGYTLQEENLQTDGYRSLGEPYLITADLSWPLNQTDHVISIDPFANEAINQNPLTDVNRNYSTDFYYPINKSFFSEILIPDNYLVSSLPEDFSIKNSLIELNYQVIRDANVVKITADYKLLKATYAPIDYEKIKSYLNEIVKHFNEPVILESINKE